MKILLDTNIVLDILDLERKNAKTTEVMMNGLLKHEISFYCSMDALSTITHIRKARGEKAIEIVKAVLSEFDCLTLISDDAVKANMMLDDGVITDYEDAQLISTAVRSGCVTLITNDKEMLGAVGVKKIEIVSPENVLIGLGYKKDLLDSWIDENSDDFKVTQLDEKEIKEILIENALGEIDLEFDFKERLKQQMKDLRSGKILPLGSNGKGKVESLITPSRNPNGL